MTDRPMTEWKAEMPLVLTVDCARNGEAPIVLEVCSPSFVRDILTRANEELDKVRAELDEARAQLAESQFDLSAALNPEVSNEPPCPICRRKTWRYAIDDALGLEEPYDGDALERAVRSIEYLRQRERAANELPGLTATLDAALARVRELTEWRPMSQLPVWEDGQDAVDVVVRRPRGSLWVTTWWRGQYGPAVPGCIAWLPLPEPPKEDA